jgi:hypothetical protein
MYPWERVLCLSLRSDILGASGTGN